MCVLDRNIKEKKIQRYPNYRYEEKSLRAKEYDRTSRDTNLSCGKMSCKMESSIETGKKK